MSRIFSSKEMAQRHKFSNEMARIEDSMNMLIKKAYDTGCPPDIHIDIEPEIGRPIIKIWFFRDDDSIHSE